MFTWKYVIGERRLLPQLIKPKRALNISPKQEEEEVKESTSIPSNLPPTVK
jgi:hypothetical protein